MADLDLVARSRALAKIALAGALGLIVLVILLLLLVDHTTVSEGFILVWGIFLLLASIIVGVAFAYVFMTRGVREGAGPNAAGSSPSLSIEDSGPADTREAAENPVPGIALRLLTGDGQSLYRRIVAAGGTLLQKDLVRIGLFSGPKVTRILDRLEAKGLIARERHGMTNRIRVSDAWRERT